MEKSINPGPGRPKGAQNKMSRELRETIKKFLEGTFPDVAESFDKLDDKDKINLWIRLADYVIPKPQKQDLNTGEQAEDPLANLMRPR
jgi:hypothetical protein